MKSFRDVLNGRMRTGKGRFVLASLSMAAYGKGWMGKSRLLDGILICIANWTVVLGSFTRGKAY